MPKPPSFFFCMFADTCYECCKETEMTLTVEEIKEIEKRGYKKSDFLLDEDGWLALKNKDGHCVFLVNGRCSIYEIRPKGCRFYPLILDLGINAVVFDEDCPNTDRMNIRNYQHLVPEVAKHVHQLILEHENRKKQRRRKKKYKRQN